ncbi:MAG: ABC transporter permease subunit [Bacteroidales bacterium]|nr:ABC transporter permease subunit [Bacteroidales bacterium]
MKKLRVLIINEFQSQLYSFKFLVLIFISVIVTCSMMYIKTKNFNEQLITYQAEIQKTEDVQKTFRVYSEFNRSIFIKPNPLSLFSEGYENRAGNKSEISLHEIPELESTAQAKNEFLKIFTSLDVINVVLIILGVMTIFMVSGVISSEKEDQVIRLILSNNVSRSQYFLAKYIASLTSLTIALLLVFLISILFVFFQLIEMTPHDFLKLFVMFLSCELFVSLYILLSLAISSSIRTASMSVVTGLSIWLLLAFVYPNLINYTVRHIVPSPSIQQLNASIEDIEDKTSNKVWEKWNSIQGDKNWTFCDFTHGTFGTPELVGLTQKYVFDELENAVIQNFPIVLKSQEEIFELKRIYKEELIRQRNISSYFLFITPDYLLKELSSKIAGTDFYQRDLVLNEKIYSYRSRVIDYIKANDGIGLKYFTQVQKKDMQNDFQNYSSEIKEKYSLNNYSIIDTGNVPQFQIKEKLDINDIEIVMLLIYNLLLYVLGLFLFNRSNIL